MNFTNDYALVSDGKVVRVGPRPDWRGADGQPASDERLLEDGYYRVGYETPDYDPSSERVFLKPYQEWEVVGDIVVAEYRIEKYTFEQLKETTLDRINNEYSDRTQVLASGYPENEQKSWPIQVEESKLVLAGEEDESKTPWISNAAIARGISVLELAQMISAQDTAYRQYHGYLTGTRQRLRNMIDAVEDGPDASQEFENIQWPN